LATALREATEENFGTVAFCFQPRHGVRLTKDDRTVDLLICFECFRVRVYEDDKQTSGFLTTFHPRDEFNAALIVAGIPLAKPKD
jgi:hypothetical protein